MASIFKRGGKKAKGRWYASWVDHTGRRRTKITRTTDKATAERIARKYEADAALRREGVIDATLDAISKESHRSIDSHLADYENKLRSAGRTEKYVKETRRYIYRFATAGSFTTATDINADAVTKFAEELKDKGRSARTIGAHLGAIKGFTRWLAKQHKLPRDPMASIEKPDPQGDRRLERRMLLPDEWHRLEAATRGGPDRFGISGTERLMLYRTAIQTGLRSNELRSLTRGRLHFEDKPYITCKARSTKNRKDARQYIQPELAADLRAHIAKKLPAAPVFRMPDGTDVAAMLRADLADARRQWLDEAKRDPEEYTRRAESDLLCGENHEGEVFDFHALRHTCGAWLARAGAHVKVVQQVMRHSSITLTMDTYGHLFPGQEADAVAQMRDMLYGRRPDTLLATGTDDTTANQPDGAQRQAQRAGREIARSPATPCDDAAPKRSKYLAKDDQPNVLPLTKLHDAAHVVATPCEATMSGIAPVAQRIEQLTSNQQVARSNRARGTLRQGNCSANPANKRRCSPAIRFSEPE